MFLESDKVGVSSNLLNKYGNNNNSNNISKQIGMSSRQRNTSYQYCFYNIYIGTIQSINNTFIDLDRHQSRKV